jgi:hypothetical protein
MRVILVTMSTLSIAMAVPASTQSRATGTLQTRRVSSPFSIETTSP